MRLFSYIFLIFLLTLYLPGILIYLNTLNLYQALIILLKYKLLKDRGVRKKFAEEVSTSRKFYKMFIIREYELTYYKV